MPTVSDRLTALVVDAARAVGVHDDTVELEPATPCDPRFGDYQSTHAFRLGKAARANPRAVAEQVRAALDDDPAVAEVTVAGPGFLNLRLSDAWLGEEVARLGADPRLDAPSPGAGRTVVIDYSSPNIAKRMHVGHLRSTVIGHALDRIHRFLGWSVVADNHLGDWGTPFGMLIVAWREGRDDAAFAADPVGELQRLYQGFREVAKDDPTRMDAAREATAALQAGDPEARALWQRFVDVSMAEFHAVYRRLGVSFDAVLGESFYDPMLPDTLDALRGTGLAVDDGGAVIARFAADDGKGMADQVLVLRKRDGAATYALTDAATLRYRQATWAPDRVVYVTDVRQAQHFAGVFAMGRRLGIASELEHVGFGMLRLPGGQVAATRAGPGGAINLVDVLDEAARRAREKVLASDHPPPPDAVDAIAEQIGVAAVRYADLSQNPASDVHFDWDRMLSFEGDTGPYLMYAHARCRSILRKASVGDEAPWVPAALDAPEARALALALVGFPEGIATAGRTMRPNLLCARLFALAQAFSRFYVACPVLHDDVPAPVRAGRLTLVRATARALGVGLDLLGIDAPERM